MSNPTEMSGYPIGEFIDKKKWGLILQKFIEVLQINIFIVDTEGKAFLTPPGVGRYGWKLFDHSSVGSDMFSAHDSILDRFKKQEFYLEYHYPLGLHSFAVPIDLEEGQPIAYLVIGPVILNKRLDSTEYEDISRKIGLNLRDLINTLQEVRVISFLSLKSILDLLYEVSRYVIKLSHEQCELQKLGLRLKDEALGAVWTARPPVYSNDLLSDLLDIALTMTRTECGSIMVMDDSKGDLVIKVWRGLDKTIAQNTRVKVGEGIAGLAVQEDTSYIIHGMRGNVRLKRFLKREEIKHSFVGPLKLNNRIFGVLNLHTKTNSDPLLDQKPDVAQKISSLVSSVFDASTASKPVV